MFTSSLLFAKENLPYVSSTDTIALALDLMETHDLRCIPILDESQQLYRGNIYKYHIYRHLSRGGASDVPVTSLLKNATKFVYHTDSFYTLFFKLSDLPYIAVLDHDNKFLGVVRHEDMMSMLSQSWKIAKASYAITIEIPEEPNAFIQAIKIIKKTTDIKGIITFDKDDYLLKKRVHITLPSTLTKEDVDKIIQRLERKNFNVFDIENLTHGV